LLYSKKTGISGNGYLCAKSGSYSSTWQYTWKNPSKCQHFSKSKQTSSSPLRLIQTNPEKAVFYI
jgi:hypothetical protein